MEMKQLIDMINDKRRERGFTTDPIKLCVLLTEEVGELAAEIKKTWSRNYPGTTKERLADECADILCVLSAISAAFAIDLESAVQQKIMCKDDARTWATQATEPRTP